MLKLIQLFAVLVFITSTNLTHALQHKDVLQSSPIVSGQKIALQSKVLNEQRTVLIKLPQGYEQDTTQHYPVLYTLDGGTHFQHISGTVDWLSEQATQIPPMIVVAITNTQRGRDMTASYNDGGADNFLRFIQTELLPYIDSQYRTQSFRILAGHSMAGHFALNAFNQSGALFNAVIAMSPWFHQDRGETKLVNLFKENLTKPQQRSQFIYTSIGDEARLKPMYDDFVATLEQSAGAQLKWHSLVSPTDNHMSIPSNTINQALRFVFEPIRLKPDSDIAQQGVEAIKAYYQILSNQVYGYTVSPQASINRLGYHALFTDKNNQKAIDVFKANVKLFPNSSNAYDSLAEGYHRSGQHKQALQAIEQALKLTPSDNTDDLAFYQRRKSRIENAMTEKGES